MSAAFTSPNTNGFALQSQTLRELLLALYERFYAAKANGYDGHWIYPYDRTTPSECPFDTSGLLNLNGSFNAPPGQYWDGYYNIWVPWSHVYPLFRHMQMMIWGRYGYGRAHSLYEQFVDHTTLGTSGPATLANYTVTKWYAVRSAVGPYLRRCTTWADGQNPTFTTPGFIQTGDILGPWIWEDLIADLQLLKYTMRAMTTNSSGALQKSASVSDWDFDTCVSAFDASWAATAPSSGTGASNIRVVRYRSDDTCPWTLHATKEWGGWQTTLPDASNYGLAAPTPQVWESAGNYGSPAWPFWNPAGWQQDKYYPSSESLTINGFSVSAPVTSTLPGYTGNPVTDTGLDTPSSPDSQEYGSSYNAYCVHQWAFTNA